jgi:8-hydroxy-5-deazaflavin:NADPH oxidoreductase
MSKIGIIGSGVVGETLAGGFLKYGHQVMRASREPQKLEPWKTAAGVSASVGTFEQAARFGDMIVLAVKGTAAEEAVRLCGPNNLAGKPVFDTTNPIADGGPKEGVLSYFTGPNESLMERLQQLAPAAQFVKCFSSVGSPRMVNPDFGGIKPTMFICGNDASAKAKVKEVLDQFGWETEDMGGVIGARAIEPLCITWCLPGFLRNSWTHAFKVLR